jgi:hypothetical protein
VASQFNLQINVVKNDFCIFRCNSNVDYIVSGVELLQALNVKPGDKANLNTLHSLDDLQQTFSHFFVKGAAAERSFMDNTVFKQIIDAAEKIHGLEVTFS